MKQASTGEIDLMEIPSQLAGLLNVSEWLAGLFLSLFILMLIMLPTMYLTKGKQGALYIIIGMVTLAPLTGIGWFPVWVYIIIVLAIAFGMGRQIIDFFGGLRGQ